MKRGSLLKIFWRTFFIHATLNFRRMQNLGFAYAMIPLLQGRKIPDKEAEGVLVRHLQMFNTNPYLAHPLVGSILKMEEDRRGGEDPAPIVAVKQSLMGPYAAIGDTFFWGALRPCAGICSAGLVWLGCAFAPLAFLLIYSPAQSLVRWRGFFEGYSSGKQGIECIRRAPPGPAIEHGRKCPVDPFCECIQSPAFRLGILRKTPATSPGYAPVNRSEETRAAQRLSPARPDRRSRFPRRVEALPRKKRRRSRHTAPSDFASRPQ